MYVRETARRAALKTWQSSVCRLYYWSLSHALSFSLNVQYMHTVYVACTRDGGACIKDSRCVVTSDNRRRSAVHEILVQVFC